MVTVADVRERLALEKMSDPEIESHLLRAIRDYRGKHFDVQDENYDEREAISCKTIYYLAPMLWLKIKEVANQFEESLETFKDVDTFQHYWLERAESIPYGLDEDDTPLSDKAGGIGMGVA